MAFSVTSLGSNSSAATNATVVITTGVDCPPGSMLVIVAAESAIGVTETGIGTVALSAGGSPVLQSSAANNAVNASGWNGVWTLLTTADLPSGGTITYTKLSSLNSGSLQAFFVTGTNGIFNPPPVNIGATGSNTTPSVSATIAIQQIVIGIATDNHDATTAQAWTQASGWTNAVTPLNNSSTLQGICIGFKTGVSGSQTFNPTIAGAEAWAAFELAFNPLVAPTPRWNFNYDETPSWRAASFAPSINLLGPPPANVFRPPFYAPRPPIDQSWQILVERNINLLTVAPAPFTARQPFSYYSEDAVWKAEPVNSGVIQLLTQGGKPPQFYPSFTYDDAAFWQGYPVRSNVLSILTAGGKSAPRLQWNWTLDDSSVWQGAPIRSFTIPMLTVGGQVFPSRWGFRYDDASSWQSGQSRNVNLYPPISAPFHNPQWFGADETVAWQQTIPTNTLLLNAAISLPQAIGFYVNTPDDNPTWQWAPPKNASLAAGPQPSPLTTRMPSFYSEDVVWSGVPTRSQIIRLLTQGGQPPVTHWVLATQDDPSVWQGKSLAPNASLFAPVQTPFTARQPYFYSEDAFWLGKPNSAQTLALLAVGGRSPQFRPSFTYDDASVWTGAPVNSKIISLLTAFNGGKVFPRLLWNYGLDSGETYWPGLLSPAAPNLILLTTPIGRPLNIYRWNFNSDDPPMWTGSPLSSLSLYLPITIPPVILPPPAGGGKRRKKGAHRIYSWSELSPIEVTILMGALAEMD